MSAPTRTEVRKAIPPATRSLFDRLVHGARELDLAVHLVGGPVRDLLLGRELRDVDLLVEGHPTVRAEDWVRHVAPEGSRVVPHGRFGTVSLVHGAAVIDVATARCETYAHFGALPKVAAAGLEEDLKRRDFSVNAMALPLSPAAKKDRPPVIDPAEGLVDLAAGVLRVLHPGSFHDDPTRALRAARLAPRLGFSLARATRAALRGALRDGAFGQVSGERFQRELEKVFADTDQGLDPASALSLLDGWHVLPALEPGLHLPRSAGTPLRRLGRLLREPVWAPGPLRGWVPGFSLWLGELGRGLRSRTLRRFAVRGASARRIAEFPRRRDQTLQKLARARGRGAIDAVLCQLDEEDLHALVSAAPSPTRRRIVRYAAEDRARELPLGGSDLVELGLEGPAVGRALARIRTAYLDGTVKTRLEVLALARELATRRSASARGRKRSGS